MPSLVLTPRLTSDSRHLETAAAGLGWSVHRARRHQVPFGLEDPMVHGEISFCDTIAEMLGLGLLEPSNTWLAELPPEYLGRKVKAMTHGELGSIRTRHFIKPANDKVFEAGVFERGSHVPYRYIDPDTPVFVSDVVSFDFEIRGYVLDRKLLTAGVYANSNADGSAHNRHEQLRYESGCEWLTHLLADPRVPMPSAVVIDVGHIEGVGWATVEANQAYCSGVYTGGFSNMNASPGADPTAVLRVVERSAGLRSKVRPDDVKWLRPRL